MRKPKKSEKKHEIEDSIYEEVDVSFEKRRVARKELPQFVGAFIYTESGSLIRVHMHDISTEGLSFDFTSKHEKLVVGETVELRIYVSKENYFSVRVKIANARPTKVKDCSRYGVLFSHTGQTRVALYHFVRFLEILTYLLETAPKDKSAA